MLMASWLDWTRILRPVFSENPFIQNEHLREVYKSVPIEQTYKIYLTR